MKPVFSQTFLAPTFAEYTGVRIIQVNLVKYSYIGILFKIRFIYMILIYSGFGLDKFHYIVCIYCIVH
jgi:hypothetical protein